MELTTPRSKPDEQPLSPLVSPRLDSASVEHMTRDEQPPQVEPSVVISLIFTTRTDLVVKMLREHLDLDQDMPAAQVVEQGVTVLGLSEEVNGFRSTNRPRPASPLWASSLRPPTTRGRRPHTCSRAWRPSSPPSLPPPPPSLAPPPPSSRPSSPPPLLLQAPPLLQRAPCWTAAGSAFASIRLCFNSTLAPSQPTDELVRMRTSSSDDQIVEGSWPQGIIKPTASWKGRWDFVIMLLILYSAAVVPLRMAFSAEANGLLWDFLRL